MHIGDRVSVDFISQLKGEKPPEPVRGHTPKGGGGGAEEEDDEEEEQDAPSMVDLIPRTDIRYTHTHLSSDSESVFVNGNQIMGSQGCSTRNR